MKRQQSTAIASKEKVKILCLILAGGEGVRLWPLSTPENPKPFIKLVEGKSFLRLAYERALLISPKDKIFISTLERLAERTLQELPEFSPKNLILEPLPRNTAPAIALAAMRLRKLGEDGVMVVLPADHYIGNLKEFRRSVKIAVQKASEGECLITFGIKPESPSTEYGYLEIESEGRQPSQAEGRRPLTQKVSRAAWKVRRFTEKPGLQKAKTFLRRGNYYWNSGMFVWRIDSILKAIQKHAPDIHRGLAPIFTEQFKVKARVRGKAEIKHKPFSESICEGYFLQGWGTGKNKTALKKIFTKLNPVSIDYAVMEKADHCFMVELKARWKDFGSWSSIEECFKGGKYGDICRGNVVSEKCRQTTLFSEDGVICALGTDHLLAVLSHGKLLLLDRRMKISALTLRKKVQQAISLKNHKFSRNK